MPHTSVAPPRALHPPQPPPPQPPPSPAASQGQQQSPEAAAEPAPQPLLPPPPPPPPAPPAAGGAAAAAGPARLPRWSVEGAWGQAVPAPPLRFAVPTSGAAYPLLQHPAAALRHAPDEASDAPTELAPQRRGTRAPARGGAPPREGGPRVRYYVQPAYCGGDDTDSWGSSGGAASGGAGSPPPPRELPGVDDAACAGEVVLSDRLCCGCGLDGATWACSECDIKLCRGCWSRDHGSSGHEPAPFWFRPRRGGAAVLSAGDAPGRGGQCGSAAQLLTEFLGPEGDPAAAAVEAG
eukprot:TRINITY_DN8505_c0_g1_i1.p2 TRINITY_DN8505_c0_g1~~TRINITY_DN8505_c0_g1_i1.p2  ORF type:complete len:294 (+),score=69.70 TRINITY_DN8505_c0_g1_i1:75-956(+)